MKATIILLTYNQENTVRRAIESLLRQQCRYDWEILVADDCSPDKTREICEEYAAAYPGRVRMMPVMPNRGLVGNYFDAMEASEGDYVADCAGDDEWVDPSRLERSIEMLDADEGLSVVFTDVEMSCGDERRLASSEAERHNWMRRRIGGHEILRGVLNHTNSLPYILSSALYRKSAVMKIYGAHREMVRCEESGVEDVALIAALAQGGDAAWLPLVGYRYYVDGESISNNLSFEKEFWFHARVMRLILKLARFYGEDPATLRDYFDDKITHICAQARHAHSRRLALEARQIAREWGMPVTPKGRLNLFLMGVI